MSTFLIIFISVIVGFGAGVIIERRKANKIDNSIIDNLKDEINALNETKRKLIELKKDIVTLQGNIDLLKSSLDD